MKSITSTQRRELRARAHALHPVVAIGHAGLTPAVLHEIDVALVAHELIKVRVHSDDRDERAMFLARICDELDAAPVQHLGKLLILWRPPPKPAPEARPRERPGRSPAHRRAARGKPAPGKPHGPPAPHVGERASRHRRGASRHLPRPADVPDNALETRRRLRAETGTARPRRDNDPERPAPGAPRRRPGANERDRQPESRVKPGGNRPPRARAGNEAHAKSAAFGGRRDPAASERASPRSKRPAPVRPRLRADPRQRDDVKRPSPSDKRTAARGKRTPATVKRGASVPAPPAVRRRRRPTGGR